MFQALTQDLEACKSNNYFNAKKKAVSHKTLWQHLVKSLEQLKIFPYHQVSHTSQETETAAGNKEVDRILYHVNAVTRANAHMQLKRLHDQMCHPTTNTILRELKRIDINIPNAREKYTMK